MARKTPEPIVQSLAVLRPVGRVWGALTSRRDLGQLLLGRVEMTPEPGKPFAWQWGVWDKVAPRGGPGRYTWKGMVLDVVPGSTLVLGPPVVTVTVKGQAEATLVTIVQGAPPPGETVADCEHGWADFLLKLKTYLETETLEREVLARALVRAKPQQVYRAWLSSKTLAKLLPGKAKLKAKVGERFSWQHKRAQHVRTGKFLELSPPKRIAFTWEGPEGPGQPVSEVKLEGQAAPYGTLVSVHHTGLLGLNRGQLFSQRMFWMRLLERLRCYFYFKGKIKTTD